MKSKTLLLACVLSASAFSFDVYSQESKVCADPIKTICTDTVTQRAEKNAYITKLKEEIRAEARINAEPRIAEMKKQNGGLRNFFKRIVRKMKIQNQEIMKSAKSRIGGLETIVTNPKYISLLKNYMKQAIDESSFNQTARSNFKSTIDQIQIGNFNDFLEKTGLEDNLLAQLLGNPCGSDGMVANAFATDINGQKYVLICPGFLITLSQTASEQERLDSILHAISHELAHHIDNSKVGDEIYKPYLTCLSENYSEQFNKTADDIKFCKKKAKDQAECNMKVTTTHGGELIADQWGIKVLAIHARTQGYSVAQADSLLTNSWVNLCGTTDEGIHPAGDFRIGTLLRLNPGISDYLTCNNSAATRPACTLDGAVNL